MEPHPRVGVVIPTLNAQELLPALKSAFDVQAGIELSVCVVDSESTDATPTMVQAYGWRLVPFRRSEFQHGLARNAGARAHTDVDVLAFLTQDALPATPDALALLVGPILSGQAIATFGRHVPHATARLGEQIARRSNYPAEDRSVCPRDVPAMGFRAYFFSNSFSAVDPKEFWTLGGFNEECESNEDMLFAHAALASDHCVAYVAGATVIHSHDLTLAQHFARSRASSAAISTFLPEGPVAAFRMGGGLIRSQIRGALDARDARALAEAVVHGAGRGLGAILGAIQGWMKRDRTHRTRGG